MEGERGGVRRGEEEEEEEEGKEKGKGKVGRDDESELGYEFNAGGTMRYWPIPFDKSDNLFH